MHSGTMTVLLPPADVICDESGACKLEEGPQKGQKQVFSYNLRLSLALSAGVNLAQGLSARRS